MAAILRAAMGRAGRRVVSEDLLSLFRGTRPSPNPAAAAAAEAQLITKKPDVAVKRGSTSTSRYAKRSTHMRSKTYIPLNLQAWFVGALLTCAFLEGYETGRGNDKKIKRGRDE